MHSLIDLLHLSERGLPFQPLMRHSRLVRWEPGPTRPYSVAIGMGTSASNTPRGKEDWRFTEKTGASRDLIHDSVTAGVLSVDMSRDLLPLDFGEISRASN